MNAVNAYTHAHTHARARARIQFHNKTILSRVPWHRTTYATESPPRVL